jgi:hypothetical protein
MVKAEEPVADILAALMAESEAALARRCSGQLIRPAAQDPEPGLQPAPASAVISEKEAARCAMKPILPNSMRRSPGAG